MQMWSELYRPKTIDDCVLSHLDETEERLLKNCVTFDRLPYLLFTGTPGTGKTTTARILCDENKFCVTEINGSLAGKNSIADMERWYSSGNLYFPYRCILIDEVDGVTGEGQKALRSMMESTFSTAIWIFTANNYNSIIDPIKSRMICIDFSVPEHAKRKAHLDGIVRRCEQVLQLEGWTNFSEERIRQIAERNYPDIRQTLNQLQMIALASAAA